VHDRCLAFARCSVVLVVAALAAAAWPTRAAAQGLFEFLFSGRQTSAVPSAKRIPAQEAATARTTSTAAHPPARFTHSAAYCVRLCDGRYFPVQPLKTASAAQLCNAFCPASPAKIFYGSEIKQAVSSDGARYTALANAFAYRKRLVPDCTCNGKDAFGLAAVHIAADPTLRPGDLVSPLSGLPVSSAPRLQDPAEIARFTSFEERFSEVAVR
jgi:hypothetical protein